MKTIARWLVDFTGGLVSLYGAMVIGANGVTLFYLLNGTIEPGEQNKFLDVVPDILPVVLMFIIGVILLTAGYKGPKYFAAFLGTGNNEPEEQSRSD